MAERFPIRVVALPVVLAVAYVVGFPPAARLHHGASTLLATASDPSVPILEPVEGEHAPLICLDPPLPRAIGTFWRPAAWAYAAMSCRTATSELANRWMAFWGIGLWEGAEGDYHLMP